MAKAKKAKIDFPGLLLEQLGDLSYAVTRELRFHPVRRWRFDLALEALKLAIEVDGGLWIRGRHARPAGIIADNEKINNATLLGWRVLKVTTQQVRNGYAADLVKLAVAAAAKGYR